MRVASFRVRMMLAYLGLLLTAVRAAVLRAIGEPLAIEEVELAPPGPGEATCTTIPRTAASRP